MPARIAHHIGGDLGEIGRDAARVIEADRNREANRNWLALACDIYQPHSPGARPAEHRGDQRPADAALDQRENGVNVRGLLDHRRSDIDLGEDAEFVEAALG